MLRILYILSANPIGEFSQELVYLRARELRQVAYVVFLVVFLQLVQFVLPFLATRGWVRDVDDLPRFLNAAESVLVLGAAVAVLLVVRRYTHRALDRRIRESMETLAYLEEQRRRRKSIERSEWQEPADED